MEHLLAEPDQALNERYIGEIAGRIKAINEIIDLPFEAIVMFYQKEEEFNEAQAVED